MGLEFQELLSSYGILSQATVVKNPRGNSVVKRMHLTMADMLRTMEFDGLNWQRELHSCLQAAVWAIRAKVSTMSNYSPTLFVFSKDMVMQTKVVATPRKTKLVSLTPTSRETKS